MKTPLLSSPPPFTLSVYQIIEIPDESDKSPTPESEEKQTADSEAKPTPSEDGGSAETEKEKPKDGGEKEERTKESEEEESSPSSELKSEAADETKAKGQMRRGVVSVGSVWYLWEGSLYAIGCGNFGRVLLMQYHVEPLGGFFEYHTTFGRVLRMPWRVEPLEGSPHARGRSLILPILLHLQNQLKLFKILCD